MTIAEFVTTEEGLKIAANLASTASTGSFWCDRLYHVAPDPAFRFQQRGAFYLGARRSGSRADRKMPDRLL
jgi:hypothetical protein